MYPRVGITKVAIKAAAIATSLWLSTLAQADVNVKAAENIDISLRTRIQPVYYFSNSEVIAERDRHDFRIRRARLSVKATMDKRFTAYLQTGYSEQPTSSNAQMQVIDAYVSYQATDSLKIYAGQFLAPALRQNVTSAGALMTIDRPGIIYKSLSWGTRALGKFASLTMNNTDSGLRGNVDVRDEGVMLLGSDSISDALHYKYYISVLEGARTAQSERALIRGQLNFGDAEPGLFNTSTYFGRKQTLALGFSFDSQSNVALNSANSNAVDYTLYSIDAFLEQPIGKHSISVESAWIDLDLGSAEQLLNPITGAALSSNTALQSQGNGFYIQSGLTVGQWQPWFGYESWKSDASDDTGSYSGSRLGVTYIIKGHQANIKFGVESIKAEQAFATSNGETDELTTVSGGIFFTF